MAQLVWTAEAIADIEAIRDYISRTSPRYGALTAARLVQALNPIKQFPESGRTIDGFPCHPALSGFRLA